VGLKGPARLATPRQQPEHCLLPSPPRLSSSLWNLKEFLPPALQEHLVLLLAEFVYRPWKEAAAAALRGASQGGSQAVADAQQAQDTQVRAAAQDGGVQGGGVQGGGVQGGGEWGHPHSRPVR
jgi:uncharacterized membrane protein